MKVTKHNRQKFRGKKTKKRNIKIGGHIDVSRIFSRILSIGFEIETTDLIKLTLTPNEDSNDFILINSSLTNLDLEYGYVDENEYTYIANVENIETFKITNDSAEDSEFNEIIEKHYRSDEKDANEDGSNISRDSESDLENTSILSEDETNGDDEYDEDIEDATNDNIVILRIPNNQYLNQLNYEIKFREASSELITFSDFTDTEFIATYYKPNKSKNIIKEYLFKSIRELRDHLSTLVTINDSKMIIKKQDEEVAIPDLIDQVYVLPNTSLVYFNSSLYKIENYNIKEDLKIVVQLTFSCNILDCFKIMIQLLSIIDTKKCYAELDKYKNIKNASELYQKIYEIENNLNYDEYAIKLSIDIVKKLFNNYNQKYNTQIFDNNREYVKKIKSYLFLIIYKLFIYLNSYVREIDTKGNMLKKHLSFAIRHNNHALFSEIKKILESNNIDNSVMQQLLDEKILNKLYDSTFLRNKKTKLKLSISKNPETENTHFGNPLLSINSYFEYFNQSNSDWLVETGVDEKSTKFELENDVIIIEFRDFPIYSYLELFLMGDNNVKNEILNNNVGTLNMRIFNHFI